MTKSLLILIALLCCLVALFLYNNFNNKAAKAKPIPASSYDIHGMQTGS